jgi:hypothetical protein
MNKVITPTYWNGLLNPATRGTAVVADDSTFPQYWAREEGDLIGERIPVVRVVLAGAHHAPRVTYLDNRNGKGWFKVTDGHGLPTYGHSNVTIEPDSYEEE